MAAAIVTLIFSDDTTVGAGTPEDPVRIVYRLYTPSGKLVVSYDPLRPMVGGDGLDELQSAARA